jgi:hypothetical protein
VRKFLGIGLALVVAGGLSVWIARGGFTAPPPDVTPALAEELGRWKTALADEARADTLWTQVRAGAQTVLTQADQALADGRTHVAAERLIVGRQNLAAANYVAQLPAGATEDLAALEAEWQRMRGELGVDTPPPAPSSGSALRRAIEEAAAQQLKVYYDASLPYARNTTPLSGYTYLGIARSQQEAGRIAASLVPGDGRRQPRLRSIRPDIDALQAELLGLYRPPVSIEKHPDFIATSSLLKEARELDAAGRHYGALLRYLQAAMRFGMLEAPAADALPRSAARARAAAELDRAAGGRVDHSVARLFAERAAFEVDRAESEAPPMIANAILARVLPRYYAALEPAPAAAVTAATPAVTITLVRWPYT